MMIPAKIALCGPGLVGAHVVHGPAPNEAGCVRRAVDVERRQIVHDTVDAGHAPNVGFLKVPPAVGVGRPDASSSSASSLTNIVLSRPFAAIRWRSWKSRWSC